MIIQLSSGQGPAECELAVKKLYDSLKKEFPDIEIISSHKAKRTEGCTSILFQNRIYPDWREVSSGFAEVLTDQLIKERTGL